MGTFITYLKCGRLSVKAKTCQYEVTKIGDNNKKIIPFFNLYKIRGKKALDYLD